MIRAQHNLDTETLHLLQQAAHHFNNQRAYLVGGSVRNLLLHEPCIDWDIVTDGDAPQLARRLANKLGGYYAHMHDKASRVVCKLEQQEIIFDIAPLQGDTIEADLHQRDFTINAIASPLTTVVEHLTIGGDLTLIDPLNGRADCESRLLRAVNDAVFKHDPLRLLRAVRFMTRYHLSIEPGTEQMLTRDASQLPLAAPERTHEELYAILRPDGATERLRFLDRHGLFTTLFPEFIPARGMRQPYLHHWDVLGHSLETVAMLEQLTTLLQQSPEHVQHSPLETEKQDLVAIQSLLREAEQQGIFQFAILTTPVMKMAALLHDIGKPVTYSADEEGNIRFYHHPQAGVPLVQQIMGRLHTSTQERRLVQQVTAHHMRPGQLSSDTVTPRAIRRYFVDLGPTGLYVALVSLADHLAMRGPEPLTAAWANHIGTTRLLFTRYIRERDRIIPPRLVAPEELIRALKLERGPLIGQLLDQIAEAQAEGLLHSKEDVLWFAQEKLQKAGVQTE